VRERQNNNKHNHTTRERRLGLTPQYLQGGIDGRDTRYHPITARPDGLACASLPKKRNDIRRRDGRCGLREWQAAVQLPRRPAAAAAFRKVEQGTPVVTCLRHGFLVVGLQSAAKKKKKKGFLVGAPSFKQRSCAGSRS